MKKPWIAIVWFSVWGLFQAYAVASVLNGTWTRPEAFPEEAYNALVYPDLVFIPLYLATAVLLWRGHWLGPVLGLLCGGAMIYGLTYLYALANFQGALNLAWDSVFFIVNAAAVLQIITGLRTRAAG